MPYPESVVMLASILRASKVATIGKATLFLIAVELAVVVGVYWCESSRLHAIEKEVTYGNAKETKHFWKYEMPGLRNPQALPVEASRIAEAEEVIGVMVNGKPRAYRLKALRYPPWHIVNDVVVGVPITVTFCDRTNCTRVYTSHPSSTPLDIDLGGLFGREMVVKAEGILYLQQTGKPLESGADVPSFPYTNHPWERTTWKAWRQQHPETDLFVGLEGRGPRILDTRDQKDAQNR
jgi:hypothetical protein